MTDKEITIEIIEQPDIVIELNEQGPQGPAGPIGPQGNAGTIDVGTVFTQPYGSDMRVVNRGTSQSAVLDFYLTEGPQGIQGLVGEAGGTYPEYNASTSALDFYTWNDEGDLLPPQAIHYLSELENDVGYITSSALEPINAELEDCVKITDYASEDTAGICKINPEYGIDIVSNTNELYIVPATTTDINTGTDSYKPIVSSNINIAVKKAITTNTIALTDTEKANAQSWLGIDSLIGNIETALGEI